MKTDLIDALQDDWAQVRPDLDAMPMGVVLRIQVLAKLLYEQTNHRLRDHGLEWWQYDVLSALRRQGPPHSMPASRLAEEVMLTSGAMTNRIDRLEALGWVLRKADAHDRRRVLATLTAAGLRLVDQATGDRFEAAREAVQYLSRRQQGELSRLLRGVLLEQAEAQPG